MSNISVTDWGRYFPFDKIRPEQEKAIDFILNAFINNQKQFCLMEMAVGTGKSATGITVARYIAANPHLLTPTVDNSGAYVLTTQKILQEQYVNDFGPKKRNLLRSIKSSSNYVCQYYSDQNCGESRRILNKLRSQLQGTDFFKRCISNCQYVIDKQAFINSPMSITNFSYFLAETKYAGKLEPRQLLIVDECHNISNEISKFIEISYSEKFAKDVLKCKIPVLKGDDESRMTQVFEWVVKTYQPKLTKHLQGLEKALLSNVNTADLVSFSQFSKQYETLDKHVCKVNRFISSFIPDNWVMNTVEPPINSRSAKRFEFKPIDVSSFTHDTLFRFGSRVLMMSATVVDKEVFCRTVGLDEAQVAFLSIPSPFPVQNRLIHYLPVGKMSLNNISNTLPKMAESVKFILNEHAKDKGVIHSVNFKIAQYLFEHVKSDRLLIHNSNNREEVLNEHINNKKPTVLLSPSMMEGVDLVGDVSRFQILCKIPFPYLGDKVVKKRKARDSMWYPFQTVKSVIQSMGRSIRNDTDYAVSYILDEDWAYFFKQNRSMFSDDFVKLLAA